MCYWKATVGNCNAPSLRTFMKRETCFVICNSLLFSCFITYSIIIPVLPLPMYSVTVVAIKSVFLCSVHLRSTFYLLNFFHSAAHLAYLIYFKYLPSLPWYSLTQASTENEFHTYSNGRACQSISLNYLYLLFFFFCTDWPIWPSI